MPQFTVEVRQETIRLGTIEIEADTLEDAIDEAEAASESEVNWWSDRDDEPAMSVEAVKDENDQVVWTKPAKEEPS